MSGKKSIVYFGFIFTSIAILSQISGFAVGNVKSFNWDIALMLTPYGIVQNVLLNETYLTPYYFQTQTAAPLESPELMISALILHVGVAAALYIHLRRAS